MSLNLKEFVFPYDHSKEIMKPSLYVREKITNSETCSHLQQKAGGEIVLPLSNPRIHPLGSQLLQGPSSASIPTRVAGNWFTSW